MQGCAALYLVCRGGVLPRPPWTYTQGGVHPKGTCSASLHCVVIAPYERLSNPYSLPEGVSKEGGPQPSLFGRFKGKGFLRKGGNRNPSPLKPFFGYFLSSRKESNPSETKGKRKMFGADRVVRPYHHLKSTPRSAKKGKFVTAPSLFRSPHKPEYRGPSAPPPSRRPPLSASR